MSEHTIARPRAEEFHGVDAIMIGVLPELDGKLALDLRLDADLGVDSLSLVEIVVCIETQFGVDVPDDRLDEVETVRDLVELVAGH